MIKSSKPLASWSPLKQPVSSLTLGNFTYPGLDGLCKIEASSSSRVNVAIRRLSMVVASNNSRMTRVSGNKKTPSVKNPMSKSNKL